MKRLAAAIIGSLALTTAIALPPSATAQTIDIQAPVITVIRPANHFEGWHNSAVEVTISVSDAQTGGSGVRGVELTMEGATVSGPNLIGNPYQFTISKVGSTKLTINAWDGADNPAEAVHWVGVDVDAPSITHSGLTDGAIVAQHSLMPFHYSCWDAHSGNYLCMAEGTAGLIPSGGNISTSRLGANTLTLRSRDKVGNLRNEVLTYEVLPATLQTLESPAHATAAQVGDTLVSTVPRFDPAPDAITYQWLRDGAPIANATQSTYTLTPADLGTAVRVQATGVRADFGAGNAWSVATDPVAPAPAPTGIDVRVRGTAAVGQTLTAAADGMPAGAAIAWQWLADGQEIAGAITDRLAVVAAHAGKRLSARAVVSLPGHEAATVTSSPTGVVPVPKPDPKPDPQPKPKPKPTPAKKPKVVKKKARVTAKIRSANARRVVLQASVKAAGVRPSGKVRVTLGKKTIAIGKLKGGKVTIVVRRSIAKKLRRGGVTIKVRYAGNAKVKAATSKAVRVPRR